MFGNLKTNRAKDLLCGRTASAICELFSPAIIFLCVGKAGEGRECINNRKTNLSSGK